MMVQRTQPEWWTRPKKCPRKAGTGVDPKWPRLIVAGSASDPQPHPVRKQQCGVRIRNGSQMVLNISKRFSMFANVFKS